MRRVGIWVWTTVIIPSRGGPHSGSESESRSVESDCLRPHGWQSPRNSPGQNTAVGSLSLLQGNLPDPGIKPRSPALQADSLPAEAPGKPTLRQTQRQKCRRESREMTCRDALLRLDSTHLSAHTRIHTQLWIKLLWELLWEAKRRLWAPRASSPGNILENCSSPVKCLADNHPRRKHCPRESTVLENIIKTTRAELQF